mgnify:CR=1 FL=1
MIKLTSLVTPQVIGSVVSPRKTVKESEDVCPKCGKEVKQIIDPQAQVIFLFI